VGKYALLTCLPDRQVGELYPNNEKVRTNTPKIFFYHKFAGKSQYIDVYLAKKTFIVVIKTVNCYVNKNFQLSCS